MLLARSNARLVASVALASGLTCATVAWAQAPSTPGQSCGNPNCAQHREGAGMASGQGQGMGGHMMGGDSDHAADMQVFHYLAEHGSEIRRTITKIPNGVDTVTESDNPEVAAKIKAHVASMSVRVSEKRPIHLRDPLFTAVFENASKISIRHEDTPKGLRVIETSDDPYVAKLIQAHADVVSLFIKNGRAEFMKNHEVPAR